MPYKNMSDRLANQRLWYLYGKQLPFYRAMGLEPLDLNDPWSPLQCDFCGKITGRSSAHIYRHYDNCVWKPVAMEILGFPKTYWSRRRKVVKIDN